MINIPLCNNHSFIFVSSMMERFIKLKGYGDLLQRIKFRKC